MHPILFTVGDFPLYSYGLMMAVGVLTGLFTLDSEAKRYGWDRDQITRLVVVTFLMGLVGARAVYVITRLGDPAVNAWDLITNFRSGFVYYGGLAAAWAYLVVYLRINRDKLPFWPVSDAFAMGICIGLAMGRIGCVLGGCCYGTSCDYPWGVTMVQEAHLGPVHPVQVYEFLLLVAMYAWFMLRLRHQKRFDGQIVAIFVGVYAVARYVLEFWRGDHIRGFLIEPWLSTSQFLSLIFLPLAVWIWHQRRRTAPLKAIVAKG